MIAGNSACITYTLGDGWCDDYWYIDNCCYNKYGYVDEGLTKVKSTVTEDEFAEIMDELISGYIYAGEGSLFNTMTVTENEDDGSTVYEFTDLTDAAREEFFMGLEGSLIMSFTLNAEGRLVKLESYTEIHYTEEYAGADVISYETTTMTISYGGNELIVVAPGDADEYIEETY